MAWLIRRWKGIVVTLLAVGVVMAAFGFGWAWSSIAEFNRRLQEAERHAPEVRRRLAADGRFGDVQVESFTGRGGCLMVYGVARPDTIGDLRRIVSETDPPVPVWIDIDPPVAASQPAATSPATSGMNSLN